MKDDQRSAIKAYRLPVTYHSTRIFSLRLLTIDVDQEKRPKSVNRIKPNRTEASRNKTKKVRKVQKQHKRNKNPHSPDGETSDLYQGGSQSQCLNVQVHYHVPRGQRSHLRVATVRVFRRSFIGCSSVLSAASPARSRAEPRCPVKQRRALLSTENYHLLKRHLRLDEFRRRRRLVRCVGRRHRTSANTGSKASHRQQTRTDRQASLGNCRSAAREVRE